MQAQLWHPQIAFYKVKNVKHTKGFGYKQYSFFQYNKNYNAFLKSEQLVMKIPCSFNFHAYPFDKHQCNLSMYELRYQEAVNITITKLYDGGEIVNPTVRNTIMLNSLQLPFEVLASIGSSENYPHIGMISLTIEKHSVELLMGPFYIPTGIFAALSVGSYIISPEVVS